MFEFGKGYINISTHMSSIEVKTKVISRFFVFSWKYWYWNFMCLNWTWKHRVFFNWLMVDELLKNNSMTLLKKSIIIQELTKNPSKKFVATIATMYLTSFKKRATRNCFFLCQEIGLSSSINAYFKVNDKNLSNHEGLKECAKILTPI